MIVALLSARLSPADRTQITDLPCAKPQGRPLTAGFLAPPITTARMPCCCRPPPAHQPWRQALSNSPPRTMGLPMGLRAALPTSQTLMVVLCPPLRVCAVRLVAWPRLRQPRSYAKPWTCRGNGSVGSPMLSTLPMSSSCCATWPLRRAGPGRRSTDSSARRSAVEIGPAWSK